MFMSLLIFGSRGVVLVLEKVESGNIVRVMSGYF